MADGSSDAGAEQKEHNLLRKHHLKSNFAYSRPKYREARWERAVKVYTVNLESRYLLVQGIPAVGATKELLELFALYGAIAEYRILDEYPAEDFTEVYWIKFQKIHSARIAKRKLDNRSFFGGILHVTYAPEFETVEDTREKLQERRKTIARKTKELFGLQSHRTHSSKTVGIQPSCSSSTSGKEQPVEAPVNRGQLTVTQPGTSSHSWETPTIQSNLGSATVAPGPFLWTYPPLPLPPVPLHPCHYPPPQPPWEFPCVPSAHATLPLHMQNLPPPPTPPPPPPPSSTSASPSQDSCTKDIWQRGRGNATSMACRSSATATVPTHQALQMLPHPQPRNAVMTHTSTLLPATLEKSSLLGDQSLDSTARSVQKKMKMITSAPAVSDVPDYMEPLESERTAPAPAPTLAPKKKRKRI